MSFELGKLHKGVSYEEYAAEPGLRASDLKELKRSPAHWKAAKAQVQEKKEHLEFGKVFHSIIENGEQFLEHYIVEPVFEGRTKKGDLTTSLNCKDVKDKRDAWYAELKPQAVVVQADWVPRILGMMKSIRSHRLVGNLVKNGVRETSLWVKDPDTGLTLQCRPDLVTEAGFLVDFKTTEDAQPDKWTGPYGHIFGTRGWFYAMQMAHYNHCLRVAGISRGESATIVAIEKEEPYGIMVYPLDVGNLGPGEQWRHHLTAIYASCVKTDKYPSYPEAAYALLTPEKIQLPGQE